MCIGQAARICINFRRFDPTEVLILSGVLERISPNIVRIKVEVGEDVGNGSGVIARDETIFTCEHVINPYDVTPTSIKVVTSDGKTCTPEVIQSDRGRDLAILRVKGLKGSCVFGNYEQVKVGDECYILGYPIGLLHLTTLKGMISAKGRDLGSGLPFDVLQIDARINIGNSGGAVIDTITGKLIGIVSMKYIPFLERVSEMQRFVKGLPKAPSWGKVGIMGIDFGELYNYINQGFGTVLAALKLVQVGIGWAIPIDVFETS